VNSPEDLQNPTTNFWSLSVQREIGSSFTVEVGYTGNRSYHQIRQTNANPPILTAAQAATVIATKDPNSIPGAQARRLNPNWNNRAILESTAKGEYHAGFIKFDKRMSKGFLLGANYTYSGNWSDNDEPLGITDVTNSAPQVPQDFYNYRAEWGRSVFDRPHRIAVHYSYDVPWFTSGWASMALAKIFSGWQVAGWTDAQSGQPFTIRTGVDSPGINSAGPGRPNLNPGGVFKENYDATGTFHENSGGGLRTFYIPINGTGIVVAPLTASGSSVLANSMAHGGNLGRNTFRGPSFQNWNLNLTRKIKLHEGWQLDIRSDFINLFNHTNWQNPVATMSSPTFGQNTAVPLTDARFINFTAKVKF
jgi:hypothetical protein